MSQSQTSPTTSKSRRIYLVDDHPIVRQGFSQLLALDGDLAVCGQAAALAPALIGIQSSKPDVVVLDIAMPGRDGIELIKEIRVLAPQLPTLVLSAMDETIYAKRALQAGAKGYVMKHEPVARILTAVRAVLDGEVYLSAPMRTQLLLASLNFPRSEPTRGVELLSKRELEIFRLIGEGFGTQRIAKSLNLSVSTVETHRTHIKEKLSVEHAPDLIRQAVIWHQSQNFR
jgi:DNA-binding NarL/FixJ family response regulator